jgi:hypothetical protein
MQLTRSMTTNEVRQGLALINRDRRVSEMSKSANFADLNLPVSGLCARPSAAKTEPPLRKRFWFMGTAHRVAPARPV